ncbi:MAG TPA: lipase maturation factor family protein [Kiritimatiellia bacterium]|nr:lipase maturation factor family protein [Kiritimatiellia bacterium]
MNIIWSQYRIAADIFLRAMGVIYFLAIYSLWSQIHGLIGEHGILPVGMYLHQAEAYLGGKSFHAVPTVLWWLQGDVALEVMCWIGMSISALLVFGITPLACTILLWILYLSFTVGGQVFLGFQWDNLLLESGLLAILLAPPVWRSSPKTNPLPSRLVIFLLHWLLFRLMFAAGYVKLASRDESWWDLSALTFHFWTQPLPVWTAWYFHQAPMWFLKFSTAMMFFIELVVPFLIFAGRIPRYIAFGFLMLLQFLIAGTGNYGFFNFLTMALCLPLLDDRVFTHGNLIEPIDMPKWKNTALSAFRWPVGVVVLVMSLVMFSSQIVRISWPAPVITFVQQFAPFRSVNNYGLFAAMTKSRPEIVVEGSRDGQNWIAYEFKWKPGDVHRTPIFVAPHMPRLDWQMWFAALGNYQHNPWFMNFLVRLLEGEPSVLKLLETNPFPEEPPRMIRAVLYDYSFATREQNKDEYLWWNRNLKGLYCPTLTRR